MAHSDSEMVINTQRGLEITRNRNLSSTKPPDNVKTNERFESSWFSRAACLHLYRLFAWTVAVIISPFPNSVPYARPNGFTVVVNSNSWEINICGVMRISWLAHARY